jgi:endogenous inhibitor of DNA gyrase (YacG/DUF329 family)
MTIKCPKCGRSVFKINDCFFAPWPRKKCSNCDTDLVAGTA